MSRTCFRPPFRPPRPAFIVLLGLLSLVGCSRTVLRADERPTSRPVQGIGEGYFEPRVESFVVPPRGWDLDPPKGDDQHVHLVWLSPSRDTAYGVIFLQIPGWVPTAIIPSRSLHNTVLDEFVKKMREDQGEAELVSSEWDEPNDRLNFVARGKVFTIHSFLTVRGHAGWAAYRGTKTGDNEPPNEIALADRARDATKVGRDAAKVAPAAPANTAAAR